MSKSNKLLKFFRDKVSAILHSKETEPNKSESSEWSCNRDSIVIKKKELEDMESDIFNKTEIIKKLKTSNAYNESIIEDYENAFEKISFVDYSSNSKINIKSSKALLEDELERLRNSEKRLKSHIQALKRDLLTAQQERDSEVAVKDQIISNQNKEIEEKCLLIKKQNSIIQELSISNTNLKYQLENRCTESLELVEICKELLKDFV